MVSEDKFLLKTNTKVKQYTMNKIWMPKTGQNTVKYILVIGGLVVILGVLFVIKKKSNK